MHLVPTWVIGLGRAPQTGVALGPGLLCSACPCVVTCDRPSGSLSE